MVKALLKDDDWQQIPRELSTRPRWVVWKYVERDGKNTKPPYNARTGALASTMNPTDWSTFAEALTAYRDGPYDGIGLVVTEADPLVGVDLDHCVTPDTGAVEPWAQAVVDKMRTYTEISPSGTGLRLWVLGSLPPTGRKKGPFEMYNTGRYLTVTGRVLGRVTPVHERREELLALHAEFFPTVNGNGHRPAQPVEATDHSLVDMMLHAANGAKVLALWRGDTSGYPSQSEAELALCSHLAFWCGRDAARMDRLFRQSGLMREKWDEVHGGQTYGDGTLAKACTGCTETYTPRPATNAQTSERARSTAATAEIAQDTSAEGDQASQEEPGASTLLGIGLGAFLALDFPPTVPLIEGLLSNDGGGWISGEEKLGKSYYAVEEALCLALGLPVCGRFAVPVRMRVLFIEEEDSPARAHRRVKQLLRGHGLDPDEPAVRADLDQWFRISVWHGFTLDEAPHIETLHRTIAAFRPAVVYLDVLRKLTTKNLNKGDEAGALLKVLDDLRREFGVFFRVLAHNRKIQGAFRAGRGSQELAGSHQLGAWGENSLFFEPIGKKHGAIKIEVQCKDGAPVPAFALRFEAEGPEHDPTVIRLHAEDLSTSSAAEELKAHVFNAASSLPTEEASSGEAGVSIKAMCQAVKRSEKPVRTAVEALVDEQRLREVGKAGRGRKLYGVISA